MFVGGVSLQPQRDVQRVFLAIFENDEIIAIDKNLVRLPIMSAEFNVFRIEPAANGVPYLVQFTVALTLCRYYRQYRLCNPYQP